MARCELAHDAGRPVDLVWLIPALPLAGFLAPGRLRPAARRAGRPAGSPRWPWSAAFAATVVVFVGLLDRPEEERSFIQTLFAWMPAGGFQVDVAFLVDPLSITMVLFVTGVGALIHLYSIGYMHGDENFSKFFVYLNLFVFSMLMLVLGDNLLVTFLGWEGVGRLLVLPHLVLVHQGRQRRRRQEGLRHQPHRRLRLHARHVPDLRRRSARSSYTGLLEAAETGHIAAATATAIALLLFVGAVRQVGPAAAVRVAARRHGRPDAGVGAHPRRHHGHRRRLPDDPGQPAPGHGLRLAADGHRLGRRAHRPVRRHHRRRPERHQEGAGLLDDQPARLHVPRRRRRRLRGRHLPHGHPRLLQGAAVPRRRLGDPRHARRAGHAAHGRAAQAHADHRRRRSSSAGWPSPASRRSPASGRRTRSCCSPGQRERRALGHRPASPRCSPPST